MPDPLKNFYNKALMSSLCHAIQQVYPRFDAPAFMHSIFTVEWEKKELKARMLHIAQSLHQFLPDNYATAIDILIPVSSRFSGFESMFFPAYVELYGLKHYTKSIMALEHFTQYSSAEFAVRVFIQKYPEKMMAQMALWADSDNHHVRRLASEGCRPRLPWAKSLPEFKKNPQAVLVILEKLKKDNSEYVRRSVANNLNDISKDNPQLLVKIARAWLGQNLQTNRIVKHACRSLLKQADPEIMTLFGFDKPINITVKNFQREQSVIMGKSLSFSFSLVSTSGNLGKLRIEYGIDFMKKNGKQARKIFKISEADYPQSSKIITKTRSFKALSTRKYYPGLHGLAIIVNGHELACQNFTLLLQENSHE